MLWGRKRSKGLPEGPIKQVILIRKDLGMGMGKIAAQASHASLESYLKTSHRFPQIAASWLAAGQTKIVLKIAGPEEASQIKMKLKESGIPFEAVRDAGQTQVAPGTETAIGIGPYYEGDLDKITGGLPLL